MFENVAKIVVAAVAVVGIVIGPVSYLLGIRRGEHIAKRRYASASKRLRKHMEGRGHI